MSEQVKPLEAVARVEEDDNEILNLRPEARACLHRRVPKIPDLLTGINNGQFVVSFDLTQADDAEVEFAGIFLGLLCLWKPANEWEFRLSHVVPFFSEQAVCHVFP